MILFFVQSIPKFFKNEKKEKNDYFKKRRRYAFLKFFKRYSKNDSLSYPRCFKILQKLLNGELSGQQFKERHSGSVGSQSGRSRSSAPLRSADGVFSFAKAVKAFAGWTAEQQIRETVGWFFDRSGAGEPPPHCCAGWKTCSAQKQMFGVCCFPVYMLFHGSTYTPTKQ